jgi:cytochrome bd-type quinol oxidase subunit 2
MKIKISTIITSVLVTLIPSFVFAGYGLEKTASEAGIQSQGSVSDVAGNVIGSGLTLIGVLFFILMIYAGITWMVARGNEEQSKKALNTITGAIIGLILVIASYAITSFVFDSVGGQGSQTPTPSIQCPTATLAGSGCAGQATTDQCNIPATTPVQRGTCQLQTGPDRCVCR